MVRIKIEVEMEQNQLNRITCDHCGADFTSKGLYQSHYIQNHQNQIKTSNNDYIERSENGKFICTCGKGLKLGQSLQRHHKSCRAFQNESIDEELMVNIEEIEDGQYCSIYLILICRCNF